MERHRLWLELMFVTTSVALIVYFKPIDSDAGLPLYLLYGAVFMGWLGIHRHPPKKWIEPPPAMPKLYWVVYWIMPVLGIALLGVALLGHQPRPLVFLTGLYVGAWQLVVIPLMWRKAPPRVRPWVALLHATLAAALFWTAFFRWPF